MTEPATAMPSPDAPAALIDDVPPTDDIFRSRLRTPPTNALVDNVRAWLKDGGGGGGNGYFTDAAALFAIACGWSYGDGQTLADVLHRCGFTGMCRRISVTSGALFVDTDVFVLSCDAFTVIVFRGTEIGDSKIIDAFSDFYSQPVDFFADQAAGKVHAGFQLAYLPIHDRLVDVLRDEEATPLFIIGHSLGGALAVLAAAALDRNHPEIFARLHGVYTYGQPMVGDGTFARACAKAFGASTYRHVYQHDLVPQLPPRWTTGTFEHFGSEYRGAEDEPWTFSKRSIRQVRTALVPLMIAASVFVAKQVHGLRTIASWMPYSLDDHRPQAYIGCSKAASTIPGSVVFP